jgi:hypothetical protein
LLDPQYLDWREQQRRQSTLLRTVTPTNEINETNDEAPEDCENEASKISTSYLLNVALNCCVVNKNEIHPVKKILIDCCVRREKGWLRQNEAKADNRPAPTETSNLSCVEKELVVRLSSTMKIAHVEGIPNLLSYGWGVAKSTIETWVQRACKNPQFHHDRKKRKDAGENFLTSQRKREKSITGYTRFKKAYLIAHGNEQPTIEEIRVEWRNSDQVTRQQYDDMAEEHKQRMTTILVDIARVMRWTRGQITWRQLAAEVSGVGPQLIGKDTLQRNIMNLPGSRYTTTKMFPQLSMASVRKRLEWAKAFTVFWQSAQILTDSKYFWCISTRSGFIRSLLDRIANKFHSLALSRFSIQYETSKT